MIARNNFPVLNRDNKFTFKRSDIENKLWYQTWLIWNIMYRFLEFNL